MRTWLRLTSLFGPPDDKAESGNLICAAIGSILRADAEDIVRGPMPEQLAKLLRQIAATELEQLAVSRYRVKVSDAVGLIVVAAPCGAPPDMAAASLSRKAAENAV
jgi:hypothetical protein